MSNSNVKNAISLVKSIKKMIENAKSKGENSVKVPYEYWYDNQYVGELAFKYFNSEKMPMMVMSNYVDGKPVGQYISVVFNLNPELSI